MSRAVLPFPAQKLQPSRPPDTLEGRREEQGFLKTAHEEHVTKKSPGSISVLSIEIDSSSALVSQRQEVSREQSGRENLETLSDQWARISNTQQYPLIWGYLVICYLQLSIV